MINAQFFRAEYCGHTYRIMQCVLPNDRQFNQGPQLTNPDGRAGEPNLAYYTLPLYYTGDPENDLRTMWMKEMARVTYESSEVGYGPVWCVENNDYVYPVWGVNELDSLNGIARVNAYVIQGLLYIANT